MAKRDRKGIPNEIKNHHVAARVALCYDLLVRGFTSNEVHSMASEAFRKQTALKEGEQLTDNERALAWNVTDRQVRNYFAKARKQLEEIRVLKREQIFGLSHARREHIYRLAMEKGAPHAALRVQDSIDRLHDLDPTVGGGDPEDSKPQGIKLPDGTILEI
jgi:galactokinase/mevalonate kinase-like predicted kinase